jgi:hypothetical protein
MRWIEFSVMISATANMRNGRHYACCEDAPQRVNDMYQARAPFEGKWGINWGKLINMGEPTHCGEGLSTQNHWGFGDGAGGGIRTLDLLFTKQLLYP